MPSPLITLVLAFLATVCAVPLQPKLHPDTGLNVLQLIERHGYPLERHQDIRTEDGYLLEMHRIPYGKTNATRQKYPVLFMHGLCSSSADWVNMGPGRSLPYALADLGYDVWLANARGNAWGRKHEHLDPKEDKEKFWDFSFNEVGTYDLPALIDHILETTKAEQLFYIGHSQGTTSFWVLCSEKPEYNEKIRYMQALGPAAFMKNVRNPFVQLLSKYQTNLEWLREYVGIHEFLPHSKLVALLGEKICTEDGPFVEICKNFIFLIVGFDPEELDPATLPVIATNAPSGSSSKQFLHYSQGVKSGGFKKYDYHSEEKNFERYGLPEPPHYNLTKVTAPVALHYGKNDILVSIKDVEHLRSQLGNVVVDNEIAFEKFNHLDFIFAIHVFDYLYSDMIAEIQQYS